MKYLRHHFFSLCNIGYCLMLLNLIASAAYANEIKSEFSLLHHDVSGVHFYWTENGNFSTILQQDVKDGNPRHIEYAEDRKLRYRRKKISRTLRFALHPQVFVKPFILVEELQNALIAYQIRKSDQQSMNKNLQPRISPLPAQKSFAQTSLKNSVKRTFLFSPYHNRLYGIHLEIQW